ncbi:RNA polymerase sigma factor [Metabacillus herbersteinensis]|uniref:RNA polymerase sigma factor n=1 Tax=Metabacillus herbersteinensis TaxID=283816 RepID=A0ABV6GNH8_9BACI
MENPNITIIIENHRTRIEKTIKKMIKNPSLVDDIVQDATIKVYTYFQDHTHEVPQNLEAWVTTISKNTAYDHLRKLKRNQNILSTAQESFKQNLTQPHSDDPERAMISKEMISEVKEVFHILDQETKDIFILRNQGLSYQEIAKLKKLSLGKVKTKIFRGRKKMMDYLLEKGVL